MEVRKMSKISITELASVLMDKHGLKRTEAELFIRQLVVVVNESLKKDKVAKLKGLGTFKVQSVSPRKSVDVNTGEAIVIEGRDKITFTADATMRDLVNAPFAQFETVVVNEGVDFSSIDEAATIDSTNSEDVNSEDVKTEEDTKTEEEVKPIEEISDNKVTAVADDNINPDNVVENSHVADNSVSTLVATDNITHPSAKVDQPEEEADADNAVEEIATTIVDEQPTETTNEEVQEVAEMTEEPISEPSEVVSTATDNIAADNKDAFQTKQISELAKEKEQLELETINLQSNIAHYQKRQRIMVWSLVSIAVILVAGIVYTGSLLEKSNNRIEHLIAQNNNLVTKLTQSNANVDNTKFSAEQDSIKAINDSLAMIAKQKAENTAKANQPTENVNAEAKKNVASENNANKQKTVEQKTTSKTSVPSQDAYNKDPRIRTGAYIITGIAQTITVREGQTLASISRTYLGAGMECYIEAVNGGNKQFKVGDKVKIPELKTKKSLKN